VTDLSALGDTPIDRLKELMVQLRGNCPWDSAQSFETIAPYTIEEAYEVSDCIDRKDLQGLKEELGDLLFQVVFHAIMGQEAGAFDFDEVCDSLTRKMVDRHPHIFGNAVQRDVESQTQAWEDLKAQERKAKGQTSILDGVALGYPALMRAQKLQKRAARVGFDWPDMDGVIEKMREEEQEVLEALETGNENDIENEIGDLMFSVVNLARKAGIDAEKALRRTNRKFQDRFNRIEAHARDNDRRVEDMSLNEMETVWQKAKGGS